MGETDAGRGKIAGWAAWDDTLAGQSESARKGRSAGELVLSRVPERGQGRPVLKSSGKLGMVAFGVLALFFVGYLLWSLIFPPLKPVEEEEPGLVRPQVRMSESKAAPDIPNPLSAPRSKSKSSGARLTLPEPGPGEVMEKQGTEPPVPRPQLPPAPPIR